MRSPMPDPIRVTFLQTHPIQYMAPWFRHIATRRPEIALTVLYGSTPTRAQQGVGFGDAFEWDVDLMSGYDHSVLSAPRAGARFDADSFAGIDAAGVGPAIRD